MALLFDAIEIIILVRVFISWLPVPRDHRLVDLLYRLTEPILAPIRALIERFTAGRNMMFDFSPIVAFLLIGLIRNLVLSLLR
jgi:YggT family protein